MRQYILQRMRQSIFLLQRTYSSAKTKIYILWLRMRYPWITLGHEIVSLGKLPFIHASITANITIGDSVIFANTTKKNFIGIYKPCSIIAFGHGEVRIGRFVGLSGVSICAHDKIEIGDHVLIGANTMIFDTNFHSLDYRQRRVELDISNSSSTRY